MTAHLERSTCLGFAAAFALAAAGACGFSKDTQGGACFFYVVTSDGHTCARKTDGQLYCWGNNQYGQLGIDTRGQPVALPTQVTGVGAVDKIFVPTPLGTLSSSTATTCARTVAGQLYCWGNNQSGQLGVGDTSERAGPVLVAPEVLGEGRHSVTGGAGFFCNRRPSDTTLWCWGNNEFGQLGDGTNMQRSAPVKVEALGSDVSGAAAGGYHVCVKKNDNTLWCWGQNRYGQLGTGDTRNRSTPAQVTSLGSDVAEVFAGAEHTCVVKTDRSLWCWGINGQGQLGLGDARTRTTPERVDLPDLGMGIAVVSAGAAHTCAVKADASLWCWGSNTSGQLGNLSKEASALPTPVDTGHMSAGVAVVYAGGAHTCARTSDNALWCWGQNQYAQLGVTRVSGDATQPILVAEPCN